MAEIKKAMSESTKDILKCIIVLTAIALVAGVLLGVVNFFTYVDPDVAMLEKIGETYGVGSSQIEKANERVINKSGEKSYVNSCFVVYETAAKGKIKTVVYLATGSGAYSGTVQLLFSVTDGVVDSVSVYSSSETSGIGSKVLSDTNLSKYKGIVLSDVDVSSITASGGEAKKDGAYVSGATKTTKGVLSALKAVAYSYMQYENKGATK